ncbi:hypothetical protein FUAX_38130 [Fulvitalea axinellae]|uniref:PH domain-containing protein n=1 Tax=Fulvitalea axinellae TaxID=1182444 RepID=A0AAU9DDW0_9BACT|nr:hypothetical protein FUAX_38130 [Fulvitalea axinellae]
MKWKKLRVLFLSILVPLYTLSRFTDYKVIGNWSVGFMGSLIFILSLIILLKKFDRYSHKRVVLLSLFGLAVYSWSTFVSDPFISSKLNSRSFLMLKVDGQFFNAYFQPVGSYSGGQGNLTITKTHWIVPFLEKRKYYLHAIHEDLSSDFFEGEKVDTREVVKSLVKRAINE